MANGKRRKCRTYDGENLQEVNSFSGKAYLLGLTEEENGCYYLLVAGGDVTKKITMVSPEKRKFLMVKDFDGIPHTVVKMHKRTLKAFSRSRSANQLFAYFNQWFSEGDIRNFFYELWIKHHNYHAIKKRRREVHDFNEMKNKGMISKNADSGHIRHITKEMSVREAARNYSSF